MHQCVSLFSVVLSSCLYLRGAGRDFATSSSGPWVLRYSFILILTPILISVVLFLDYPKSAHQNDETFPFTDVRVNDLISRNISISGVSLMKRELDPIERARLLMRIKDSMGSASTMLGVPDEITLELVESTIANATRVRETLESFYEQGINIKAGRDINFATFSGVIMRQSNLTDLNMEGVVFRNTDLSGSNLSRSNFRNSKWIKSSLNNIRAISSVFENALFRESALKDGNTSLSNFKRAEITLTNLDGSLMIGIDADQSNWIANNLHALKLNTASLNDSNFYVNDFTEAEFKRATVRGTEFLTSDFLASQYQLIFGFRYIPKKQTSEEIRLGFSRQFERFSRDLGDPINIYDDPREGFLQVKRTLEFLLSIEARETVAGLNQFQEDQSYSARLIGAETTQDAIRKTKEMFEKICKSRPEDQLESFVGDLIDYLPIQLTQIKNSQKLSDVSAIGNVLHRLIDLYHDSMSPNCAGDVFLSKLPSRIPYISRSFLSDISIGWVEISR